MEIINILTISSLAILWVNSEPTTHLRRWFGFRDEDYTEMTDFKRVVHRLLNCSLCISFWLSLILVPYFRLPIGYIVIIPIITEYINKSLY